MTERIIQKNEWVHILNTMKNFNRIDGYVNDVRGKLTFFDGNACIDDCYSLYVTRKDVEEYINNCENK
jgi:tetrahydromethanopterin S-methyltransferase subunit F